MTLSELITRLQGIAVTTPLNAKVVLYNEMNDRVEIEGVIADQTMDGVHTVSIISKD